MRGVEVSVQEITKYYSNTLALDNVTLTAERGKITTILGPSGCGKTTLLKIIAGLEQPTRGKVYFDSKDVTNLPPEKRDIGFVFQDLALFPHINVFENIAFGLRVRRLPQNEIQGMVKRVMELVGLDYNTYSKRKISQLSGGEQQRVAIARALVIEPTVLLLDEPFAHLDYKVKIRLLYELKRIQRTTGVTVIYVTHDQNEAMSVSHYIAIMNKGRLLQFGPPEEVYEKPRNTFVASFFGEANIVPTSDGYIIVRPEHVELNPSNSDFTFEGVVEEVIFQGPLIKVDVKINGGKIWLVLKRNGSKPRIGDRVKVGWKREDMVVVKE